MFAAEKPGTEEGLPALEALATGSSTLGQRSDGKWFQNSGGLPAPKLIKGRENIYRVFDTRQELF